jgi:predicted RNA-binding Zn-ribbon protein involved in translation (DUF1610 family)
MTLSADAREHLKKLLEHPCPECGKDAWEIVRQGGCGGRGEIKGCTNCEALFYYSPQVWTGGLVIKGGNDYYHKMDNFLGAFKRGLGSLDLLSRYSLGALRKLEEGNPLCTCQGRGLVDHTFSDGRQRRAPCITCFPDDPWAKEIEKQLRDDKDTPRAA